MVTLDELQAQVAASYDRLDLPSWPDPHPGSASPREEEYSRVTEPERYGIVHARARMWANRLGDVPGVEVETLAPAALDDEGHLGRFDRGVRLTSPDRARCRCCCSSVTCGCPGSERPSRCCTSASSSLRSA